MVLQVRRHLGSHEVEAMVRESSTQGTVAAKKVANFIVIVNISANSTEQIDYFICL